MMLEAITDAGCLMASVALLVCTRALGVQRERLLELNSCLYLNRSMSVQINVPVHTQTEHALQRPCTDCTSVCAGALFYTARSSFMWSVSPTDLDVNSSLSCRYHCFRTTSKHSYSKSCQVSCILNE